MVDQRDTLSISQVVPAAYVDVRAFGAKGDSVTDDSEAIKRAIAALPKTGATLFFPPGIYIHGDGAVGGNGTGNSYLPDPTHPQRAWEDVNHPANIGRDIRFWFEGFSNLTILGYGATIQSHDDNGECRNNSIFYFINCNKLYVKGLKVDGRSQYRLPIFNDYMTSQYGYGARSNITITYGKDIVFEDIESNYSMMDGIVVGGDSTSRPTNVSFINCNCYYNYRQGITLSSVLNVRVIGGNYSYTGVLRGTMPKSGIDIEATTSPTYNVIIDGATFDSNASVGLVFAAGSINVIAQNCKFINNSLAVTQDDKSRNNIVEHCYFYNCGCGLQHDLIVRNNLFEFNSSNNNKFIVDNNNGGGTETRPALFENNKIICDLAGLTTSFSGVIGFVRTNANTILRGNYFENCFSSSGNIALMIGSREVVNNTFVYNYVGTNLPKPNNYMMYFGNLLGTNTFLIKNNKIIGYSTSSIVYNQDKLSCGYRHEYTMGAWNYLNSLVVIHHNTSNGIVRLTNPLGEYEELILTSNFSNNGITTTLTCSNPAIRLANWYSINNKLYVYILNRECVIDCKFLKLYSLSPAANPEAYTMEVVDTTIKNLQTEIPITLTADTVTSISDIASYRKAQGKCVYDQTLHKPVWWDGVNWRDATGLVIQ